MIDLKDLVALSTEDIARRAADDPTWWEATVRVLAEEHDRQQRECALAYYETKNPMARTVHTSTAKEVAVVGGNRSSKTETILAELAIAATGHIPKSVEADYPRAKLRPPIRALVVCNSLTNTLPEILRKLRWDEWSGAGEIGDLSRGHWGWIPRHCLAGGSWEKAYSEKYRTLRVAVDGFWVGADGHRWSVRTHSAIQFGSYDQDLSEHVGKSYHLICNDELPPADLYREERMRTLDVRGRILTAFTPPDEIGMSRSDVSWFYDEVYERGLPGPMKSPGTDTVILWTESNQALSLSDVTAEMARYTEEQRQARFYGKFLHLSGVVYPLFAEYPMTWCFRCVKKIVPVEGRCPTCQGDDCDSYQHVVEPHEIPKTWPIVFVIDPHPRKPDACGWFAVTPSDDVVMMGELEIGGDATEVTRAVFEWEETNHVRPIRRLIDPNIATETNDKLERGWTFRMAYDRLGLRCDLANDSVEMGIQNVNELLRPDPRTRRPRFRCFTTCRRFIHGMTHWAWDEWHRQGDRELKERVRDRWKDFPDLLRYLANATPEYGALTRTGWVPMRIFRGTAPGRTRAHA